MRKACENDEGGCKVEFELTIQAPHKRFCGPQCKNDWHGRERERVRQRLREEREAKTKEGLK